MTTPDMHRVETARAAANQRAGGVRSRGKKSVDKEIDSLTRVSVAFVFVA